MLGNNSFLGVFILQLFISSKCNWYRNNENIFPKSSQLDGTVRMRDSMPTQTDGETRTAASLQRTMSSTLYK
jgi:hypothetical protein